METAISSPSPLIILVLFIRHRVIGHHIRCYGNPKVQHIFCKREISISFIRLDICSRSTLLLFSSHKRRKLLQKFYNFYSDLLCIVRASDLQYLDMENEQNEHVDQSMPKPVSGHCMQNTEADSSTTSTSFSDASLNHNTSLLWHGFLRLFKQRSMRRQSTISPIPAPRLSRRNRSARECSMNLKPRFTLDLDSLLFKPSWKNFSLAELKQATNNFSIESVIGRGGYAEVYKGQLPDGQLVAIKRLMRGTTEERISDFLSEIGVLVHINHPNTAMLLGFGIEGGMHLVLKLSLHGSLACMLNGSREKLTWNMRYKIALGTAEGLYYLHKCCQRRIIHRDIKSANILLKEDFEPQICDFGLAKWLPDQWTHHIVSKFEGTFGYLAPEYLLHGIVDEKTDVFAFGVLLLELIIGRPAVDSSQQSLVMWAKPFFERNDVRQMVDPSLENVYDSEELNRVTVAASICLTQSSLFRPTMSQVLKVLKGQGSVESSKLVEASGLHRVYSEELLDADEYNSTRYLNDLNQHRKLAMEFSIS